MKSSHLLLILVCLLAGCQKKNSTPPPAGTFFASFTVNGTSNGTHQYQSVTLLPQVRFSFTEPVQTAGLQANFTYTDQNNQAVPFTLSLLNNDSVVVIQPTSKLKGFTTYSVSLLASLLSSSKGTLLNPVSVNINTLMDSASKFPSISDSALLTLVQQQTFHYFWDFGHPVSGLSRERTSSGDLVTTGGSGFGIMSMLVGVQRNFITRAQALGRLDTILNFLSNKVTRYHGAFPHWINGATGATIPFSTQDDGGDIVETSYMIQGLLCARQFFNSPTDPNEISLRSNINSIYDSVEWNWYRQNGQNALTWNWSPDFGWAVNVQVTGWDEAMITYVLAASSPVPANTIPNIVYTNGWAKNGAMANGSSYFGVPLPLGPPYGGPLFFAHYSFLGINPHGLSDAYANYWAQDTAHATINYDYCVNNPLHHYGYSNSCWGLTASDIPGGYSASSPTNDLGTIAPTAAVSSLPYTPVQSMNAIRFFYYTLGDKVFGTYGFIDAFNLSNPWFDSDCLAIDQGPQIVMIENYRSGLLWNLLMSCPEIKTGMKNLGFSSPNL